MGWRGGGGNELSRIYKHINLFVANTAPPPAPGCDESCCSSAAAVASAASSLFYFSEAALTIQEQLSQNKSD